jgi:hypothetical protein
MDARAKPAHDAEAVALAICPFFAKTGNDN